MPALAVHVIGPGYGESIVLHLPDGSVGVIDTFAARHGRPPTLGFLRSHFPPATPVRFLAVTPPMRITAWERGCWPMRSS
jgi:hypothetical protein